MDDHRKMVVRKMFVSSVLFCLAVQSATAQYGNVKGRHFGPNVFERNIGTTFDQSPNVAAASEQFDQVSSSYEQPNGHAEQTNQVGYISFRPQPNGVRHTQSGNFIQPSPSQTGRSFGSAQSVANRPQNAATTIGRDLPQFTSTNFRFNIDGSDANRQSYDSGFNRFTDQNQIAPSARSYGSLFGGGGFQRQSYYGSQSPSVVSAAVQSNHRIEFVDVPSSSAPSQPITIEVQPSQNELNFKFTSTSSKLNIENDHRPQKGTVSETQSEDEPQVLKHTVTRPIYQEV